MLLARCVLCVPLAVFSVAVDVVVAVDVAVALALAVCRFCVFVASAVDVCLVSVCLSLATEAMCVHGTLDPHSSHTCQRVDVCGSTSYLMICIAVTLAVTGTLGLILVPKVRGC